ncbi:MAG: PorT family protein [Bacteroidetes bacterium]|nr:PorT family protein [Bacteroidota bacterium]
MINRLLLTSCLVFHCVVGLSQNITGGIRVGTNFANQSFTTNTMSRDTDSKIGVAAGIYLTVMISQKFGVQPEVAYSQMGYNLSSTNPKFENSYNYLSVPILFRYELVKNLSFHVGPQVGILVAATSTAGTSTIDLRNDTEQIDFGGAAGFGLDFGKFNGGVRYYLGFSNLYKVPPAPDFRQKNTAFQIFVGYSLFGKSTKKF